MSRPATRFTDNLKNIIIIIQIIVMHMYHDSVCWLSKNGRDVHGLYVQHLNGMGLQLNAESSTIAARTSAARQSFDAVRAMKGY